MSKLEKISPEKVMSDFDEVFQHALEQIKADAKAVGMSLTEVCRLAGVARASPDRWKERSPKTIEMMKAMQDVINTRRAAKAAEASVQ